MLVARKPCWALTQYEEEELPPCGELRKDRQLERNAFKTEPQAADQNSVLANPSVRA